MPVSDERGVTTNTLEFAVLPTKGHIAVYSSEDVRRYGSQLEPEIQEIAHWCEHFLGRPSALVGRSGNVCPFVPESLARGTLKFALVRLQERGTAAIPEIEEAVSTFRDHFTAQEQADGKIDIFGSIVMIFADVAVEDAETVIDGPQRRLKPSFVERGLMIGEFHQVNHSPGLRNPGFRPLRSPIPLLVIRHMVESDIDFLIRPLDPAAMRIRSLNAYMKFLGSSLSLASQTKAKKALKVAEAELESGPGSTAVQ